MKIAIAQINPVVADIEGNKNKILSFIKEAELQNANLVIFPEMSTVGYPPMDLLESSKLVDDNLKSLELIKGFCSSLKCTVILGFVDYNKANPPMLFNSAAVIQNGEVIFRQDKTLLPGYDVFDEYRYFSPAAGSSVFEFMGRKIGLTICEDIWTALNTDNSRFLEKGRYNVDPVRQLVSKGADVIINISASPYIKGKRQVRMEMLSHLALENGISIVYANQTGGNDSLIFDGNSFCINRKGEIYAHAKGFEEDLLFLELDSGNKLKIEIDDIGDIRKGLALGVKDYIVKTGFRRAVLGLSGGIDSALTAVIACDALGAENVFGITMPSIYSSSGSVDD